MNIASIPTPANGGASTVENRRADQFVDTQTIAPAVTVPSDAVQATEAVPSGDELKDAVKKLNEMVQVFSNSSSLNFSVDAEARAVVVKVLDSRTDEVIRQIPTEEAIAIAKAIDQFQGMLIKEKA
ncbi:flagellar protein FlaG [Chitinolyticbacter albus]|uniref:flagellar protein FlaG n=1 Tax=Chitinolyticbacter albus TaxID=2961951 RepID=UPI00210D00AD|nr:flagellar protein FlaG [Chitinolyticbacter albus]